MCSTRSVWLCSTTALSHGPLSCGHPQGPRLQKTASIDNRRQALDEPELSQKPQQLHTPSFA